MYALTVKVAPLLRDPRLRPMDIAAGALPANSVLIHIGPHKTGTTSIQGKLAAARQEMRTHGVVYPGPGPAHHTQVRALIEQPEGFAEDQRPLDIKGWKRLVRIVGRHEDTVVLSSEFFSYCTAADRARLIEQIDPGRIHLLLAARNPGSLALSGWQQSVSSGNALSLVDWLEEAFRRDRPGVGGSDFWARLDAAQLVANWSEFINPSQIHVVIINESDHGLIPATFEQLLNLPTGLIANQPVIAHNRSLTAPEVELMRDTSSLIRQELSWVEFSVLFRWGIGRQLLYTRSPPADEARLTLPAWAASQAAAEVELAISRLWESGAEIIGDMENLRIEPRIADYSPIEQVPVELAAQVAAGAMKGGLQRFRSLENQIKRLEAEVIERRTVADTPIRELAAHLSRRVAGRVKHALSPRRSRN